MIKYNLRYRGPFEYDKLVLTVLQLSNETKRLRKELEDGELNIISKQNQRLNDLFNSLTDEKGLLDMLLRLRLKTERATSE
jgi:hypothetical protein